MTAVITSVTRMDTHTGVIFYAKFTILAASADLCGTAWSLKAGGQSKES